MSIEASSDLEELFRLNITFDASQGLTIETRSFSDRARRVRQATSVTKWRNTTCLGQGSSGVVWLQQEDEVPEKCRAIKEIRKGTRSAPLAVDYRRELLALGRLSKREDLFVQFLGWYENNQSVYLAMEYFEQGDLGRHLSAPLAEDEVRVISKQLSEGLAVLHGQNWAHRDLKPANIFVVDTSPWWVKIGDFGISKRIRSGNTRFQTMIGTLDFVAPEVLNLVSEVDDEDTGDEEDEYTVAVDMWSLGCVIFQLLTLEIPFANRKKLGLYCRSKLAKFPLAPLDQAAVSVAATEVIRGLLEPIPSHRTTADAALRCEWIHGVPEPSDNDQAWQDTSRDSEAQRNSFATADPGIFSEAQKAEAKAEKNQAFRSGPVNIEASKSMTAKDPGRDLVSQEKVQMNSLEDISNQYEGSPAQQRLSKALATNDSLMNELFSKFNKLVELKSEAPPSSTPFPSIFTKDRSSEHANELPSVSKLFDQQRRSISRNSKAHNFLLPPAPSLASSKPSHLRNGSPGEVTVFPHIPKKSSHTQIQHNTFIPILTRNSSQQRATKEQPHFTTSSDNGSYHRSAIDSLPLSSYEPEIDGRSVRIPSTSVYSLDEQTGGLALVRGSGKLSTTEQRPNSRNPASIEHQTSFNIGAFRVPASYLDEYAPRITKGQARVFASDLDEYAPGITKGQVCQKEAQEPNEPLYPVFGLEKRPMVYGPRLVEHIHTGSTLSVPPVSVEYVPDDGQRRYQQPQMTGARKALLVRFGDTKSKQTLLSETNITTTDYLIRTLHYRSEDIHLLVPEFTDQIKLMEDQTNAMTRLVEAAKPGDSMLLHFSGNITSCSLARFFNLPMRPIPEAARLTIIPDGFLLGSPPDLKYIYEATLSPNNTNRESNSQAIGNIQSTMPLSTRWAEWVQTSEGDIVMWYRRLTNRHDFSPRQLPGSKGLLAFLHRRREAQLTPTYNQILNNSLEESVNEAEDIFLASNHPIDLDSPAILF